MPQIDWNAEAKKALAHVQAELSEAHRGAFVWHEPLGITLVFDNRREDDPVEKRQLEFIKRVCKKLGAIIMASAEGGESWAMLTLGWDAITAHNCMWAAWHSACSEVSQEFAPLSLKSYLANGNIPFNSAGALEYWIASRTIEAHFSNPNKWKNCYPAPGRPGSLG
jgi:hypothetical protein